MKVAVVLLAVLGCALAAPSGPGKVTLALQKALQTKHRLNIFVSFESTDATLASVTSTFTHDATNGERATAVYNALKAHAAASQKNVLAMLQAPRFAFALNVKSFWITNQIYVAGADASVVSALAAMDEVVSIDEEIIVYLDDPVETDPTINAEWGITKIRAEEAWAISGDGDGGIVGIIDTGARHTHEALRDNYRAGTHSWYDPYLFSQNPRDGQGHGTHVTGTIAGA
jgi:subtilisin family serine protease